MSASGLERGLEPIDPATLPYERPAGIERIRTLDVPSIPQNIFDELKTYEDNRRGFVPTAWDRTNTDDASSSALIITHRAAGAKIAEKYRLSTTVDASSLEQLTHFDFGTGRNIRAFTPVEADDWRGVKRVGGAIVLMDLDGSEKAQFWRYWEDSAQSSEFPKMTSEIDNSPGKGRIERLTHDEHRYENLRISSSNQLMAFSSTKQNGRDSLIYVERLLGSNTGAAPDSSPMTIKGSVVTPEGSEKKTARYISEDFSLDDHLLIVTEWASSFHIPAYIIDISDPSHPVPMQKIVLPGTTEAEEQIKMQHIAFSRDPTKPGLVYMVTNAYGNFASVISYDIASKTVAHITTPETNLAAIRPVGWDTTALRVTKDIIYLTVNIHGWTTLFAMPLVGAYANQVLQVEMDGWENGNFSIIPNDKNGRPFELALGLRSHLTSGSVGCIDLSLLGESLTSDGVMNGKVKVQLVRFPNASSPAPSYPTTGPKVITWKSFDGLEIPGMYYRPTKSAGSSSSLGPVPLIIQIHGGPEGQSTAAAHMGIHDYALNEMGCALIYPNVRGSSGYGKWYMAADNVEKREDAVKDIGALLEYVKSEMSSEIDSSKIAVTGGSYGGYMVYATLVHYSPFITCAFSRFGISHFPSFMEHTSPHRRDHRRAEYGDERSPHVREMMERISPANPANVKRIGKPLAIAHGENNTRVPLGEALRMWTEVKKRGVSCEVIVCEGEGHGFQQKSVIEYTNAAMVHFFRRFLLNVDAQM